MPRVVIGGVGYRMLCDHSLGIMMSDELESEAKPPDLLIEDLSYGPVAVAQWFLDEALVAPITRAIFVSAIAREDGRAPGTICTYRWDRALPSDDEIQRCVVDAVTGVILVDNTVVVVEWMRALPEDVIIIEVEPLAHAFGEEMSPQVTAAYAEVKDFVMRLAADDAECRALPVRPFGGGWTAAVSASSVG